MMYDGKTYRFTLDHRPSKAEAMKILTAKLESAPKTTVDMTLSDACRAYIDTKANILSPTTRRLYLGYCDALPTALSEKKIMSITSMMVQKFVNDYSVDHSPKSTSNIAHFVTGVLKSVEVEVKTPQLPQRIKTPVYVPTKEDISAIFEQIRDTRYEVPLTLAAFGLRRSEICALTKEDLHGNTLTINKALVQDENMNWVIKTTKTVDSTRDVVIPDALAEKIRQNGVYSGEPNQIYKALRRAQKKAGVPCFPLHKMRHFFASYLHDLGYSNKQIQELGGWATDNVMKTVYQHAMDMSETKASVAHDISALLG